MEMIITGKIKAINKRIEWNKVQYNLDRQTKNISVFLSGNIVKYEFLTDKDVLPEKRLITKSCCNQKIWIFTIR